MQWISVTFYIESTDNVPQTRLWSNVMDTVQVDQLYKFDGKTRETITLFKVMRM